MSGDSNHDEGIDSVTAANEESEDDFTETSELRQSLQTSVESVEGNGSFASQARFDEVNPGLEVEGLGRFGMPLSEPEIRRLMLSSHQAPFGKGEETIVDTSVRKTWEIDATKIRLCNPSWPAARQRILEHACRELGIPDGTEHVEAQLYKLLIYEPGAMFKPHKDTEKAPRMFGTLVVTLPSEHEGGDLHLTFGGKTLA